MDSKKIDTGKTKKRTDEVADNTREIMQNALGTSICLPANGPIDEIDSYKYFD